MADVVLFAPGAPPDDGRLRATWGLPAGCTVIRESASAISDASVKRVVLLGGAARPALVTEAMRVLVPGGSCVFHELGGREDGSTAALGKAQRVEQLSKAAVYAGFVSPAVEARPADAGPGMDPERCADLVAVLYPALTVMRAQPNGPRDEASDALAAIVQLARTSTDLLTLTASKPTYSAGTVFSLKSRAPVAAPQPPSQPAVSDDATKAWAEVWRAAPAAHCLRAPACARSRLACARLTRLASPRICWIPCLLLPRRQRQPARTAAETRRPT